MASKARKRPSNFDGIIQPILALEPDAVYLGGIYNQIGVFVNQLCAAGYTGSFSVPMVWTRRTSLNWRAAPASARTTRSAGGPASASRTAAQFITDYTDKFGSAPTPYGAESYDCDRHRPGGHRARYRQPPTAKSRPAQQSPPKCARPQIIEGLTGTISFDANGDRTEANYFVLQVVSADPADWGNNTVINQIQIPSPLTAATMEAMTAGSDRSAMAKRSASHSATNCHLKSEQVDEVGGWVHSTRPLFTAKRSGVIVCS